MPPRQSKGAGGRQAPFAANARRSTPPTSRASPPCSPRRARLPPRRRHGPRRPPPLQAAPPSRTSSSRHRRNPGPSPRPRQRSPWSPAMSCQVAASTTSATLHRGFRRCASRGSPRRPVRLGLAPRGARRRAAGGRLPARAQRGVRDPGRHLRRSAAADAPDWPVNLGLTHHLPFESGGELVTSIHARYADAVRRDFLHTPGLCQASSVRTDVALTWRAASGVTGSARGAAIPRTRRSGRLPPPPTIRAPAIPFSTRRGPTA